MKRNLFDELKEGFEALPGEQQGKVTLKQHAVAINPTPEITSVELVAVRERLNLPQAVFARYLRTSKQSGENSGTRDGPNPTHAALLIRMVEKYPDIFERLEQV